MGAVLRTSNGSLMPRFLTFICSFHLVIIHPSLQCGTRLNFPFNSSNPFYVSEIESDVVPLQVPAGCPETQNCLFFPDVDLANLMLAAETSVFPTGENMYSKHSPKDFFEVRDNVRVLFDEHSTFYIHQLGQYTGPSAIASYMSVPHSAVSDIGYRGVEEVLELNYRISDSALTSSFVRVEQWTHLDFREERVVWTFDSKRYPCSAIIQTWELELPRFTVENFAISSKLPGTVERMCSRVIAACTGPYLQFNGSHDVCMAYYNSLPDHDPTCTPHFGEFAGQGESLFCKYLHQWMAPLEPQLHCFHAGFPAPDINGKLKCAPTECASQDSSKKREARKEAHAQECTELDLEELTAAVVYALPYCLPSLGSSASCSKTNCTHALNTYLGRFVASGVVCACAQEPLESRLLSLLEIDAGVLLRQCGTESRLFSLPSCVTRGSAAAPTNAPDCSHDPSLYVSKGGCRGWDWQRLESGLLRDWARKKQFRETASMVVAEAECDVYYKLFQLYYGLDGRSQLDAHIANYFVSREDVFPLPDGAKLLRTHAEVLEAIRAPQIRDAGNAWIYGLCFKGAWKMVSNQTGPVSEDDGAPKRAAVFQALRMTYPGVLAPKLGTDSHAMAVDHHDLDVEDDDAMGEHIFIEAMRSAVGPELMQRIPTAEFEKRAREFAQAVWVGFRTESNLKATGNMWAVLYKHRKRLLMDLVRDALPASALEQLLTSAGAANLFTPDELFDASTPNPMAALMDLAKMVWSLIRREPCKMLPLWERSPTNFVLEASRLFPAAVTPRVQLHSPSADYVILDLPAANLDPRVFDRPYTFDPTRDLSRVVSFNMLEGEYQTMEAGHAGPASARAGSASGQLNSTLKRRCPARGFAVTTIRKILEPLLPALRDKTQCSNSAPLRKFHGVDFRQELVTVSVAGVAATMDVLKTVRDDESALVVAVHGFPSTPQEWARVQQKLQTGTGLTDGLRGLAGRRVFGMWSVSLPGWGESSRLEECTIVRAAQHLAALLRLAREEGKWDRIYVAGHGLGGLVAWETAQRLPAGLISGLISVGAAHPASQALAFRGMRVQSAPFRAFLSPMADGFVATNDFEPLVEAMEEEEWWDNAWKHEHVAYWKKTGGKALNCYYQDNFKVEDGVVVPEGLLDVRQDELQTHALFIGSEQDEFTPAQLIQHSLKWLTAERAYGTLLQYHTVEHVGHYDMMHDAGMEVAMQILYFDQRVERLRYSFWNFLKPPTVVTTSARELTSYDIPIGVYGTTLMLAFGMALEQYLGPMLTASKNGEALWRLAQIAAGVLTFAIGTSAPMWVGIPLFSASIFHFGFPQLITKMSKRSSVFRGIAGFAHHAGVCLGYMCFSLGLVHPMQGVMMFIPLTLQHTLGIIKYHTPTLYVVLLVALEVWLQLEAVFIFPILDGMSAVSMWMMVVSHWCLFLHGSYVFLQAHFWRSKDDDDDDGGGDGGDWSEGSLPPQQGEESLLSASVPSRSYRDHRSAQEQAKGWLSSSTMRSSSESVDDGSGRTPVAASKRSNAGQKSFKRMRATSIEKIAVRSNDLSPESRPAEVWLDGMPAGTADASNLNFGRAKSAPLKAAGSRPGSGRAAMLSASNSMGRPGVQPQQPEAPGQQAAGGGFVSATMAWFASSSRRFVATTSPGEEFVSGSFKTRKGNLNDGSFKVQRHDATTSNLNSFQHARHQDRGSARDGHGGLDQGSASRGRSSELRHRGQARAAAAQEITGTLDGLGLATTGLAQLQVDGHWQDDDMPAAMAETDSLCDYSPSIIQAGTAVGQERPHDGTAVTVALPVLPSQQPVAEIVRVSSRLDYSESGTEQAAAGDGQHDLDNLLADASIMASTRQPASEYALEMHTPSTLGADAHLQTP